MKILLAAINSKYIHTSLSIKEIGVYLEKKGVPCDLKEYSANDEAFKIAADILQNSPDIVGISCYIWNIEKAAKVADIIKKANPKIKMVFGGPEAAYNAEKYISCYPFVDVFIKGEGETALLKLIDGDTSKIICAEPVSLDEKPFPYSDADLKDKNRIFYYETSKGCPYSCSYCLSSAECGIRYKSVENALSDLKKFSDNGVRIVKLVDRTFNSDLKRSCEILKGILGFNTKTQFHFEIAADRVNDEFIEILSRFDEGIIRIEAGLQSINEKTLKAVHRTCNLTKLAENTRKIIESTKAIYHLDLIAGLPYEDLTSFIKSFNFAFNLNPHELQLGFLKVLPGTLIEKEKDMYGLKFQDTPPYEIVHNDFLSFDELARLKKVESVLDTFHNSGLLKYSERALISHFASPFEFFDKLAAFLSEKGMLLTPHHRNVMFDALIEFSTKFNIPKTDIAKDFLLSCKGAPLPDWFGADSAIDKEKIYTILTDDDKIANLTNLKSVKPIHRHKFTRFVKYQKSVLLASYADETVIDITDIYDNSSRYLPGHD